MAETKPTKVGQWATNANRTLEPALGEKQVGWELTKKAPARFMNWLHNVAYQWFNWCNERMFDGGSSKDFEIRGVDIVTGTDIDGGDLELGGGSSTGDGGSEVTFKVAKANQGAGAAVRTPAEVAKFAETGLMTTEGIESTAAITNGTGQKGTGNGTGPGQHGVGIDGHGMVAESDTTTPERAALYVVPQDTDANIKVMGGYQVDIISGMPSVRKGGSEYARLVGKVHAILVEEDRSTTGVYATSQHTIPAGTLKVGSTIRVRAGWLITGQAGGGDIFFAIRTDGNIFARTTTLAIGIDHNAYIEAIGTVRAVGAGAAGKIQWMGVGLFGLDSADGEVRPLTLETTHDTTGAIDIEPYTELTVGGGGNNARLEAFVVDISD